MVRNTFLILGAILILAGCGQPVGESIAMPTGTPTASTESGNAVDMELVRMFFDGLGEEQYRINPNDRNTFGEKQSHVFRWVVAAVSEAEHGDYEIQELRLSKTRVGSRSAYELTRHRAQGFSELMPGRSYVQLHIVHTASDPELHGVIDVDGPKLLSFWEEGA